MDIRLENKSLPLSENQKHINLAYSETWQEPVTFTPTVAGQNMKLEFLLFNDSDANIPYRDLHLWIDVNKTEVTGAINATEAVETRG